MTSATVGYMYRQIFNKYYGLTVEDNVPKNSALGDFSLRGQESLHSGIKSSAGWCMSFVNSATIPVIPYLEEYYNCDSSKEIVAKGAVSTEHSVMCSSATIDGDEITMVKRLLTEVYPNTSFSMVSDSYDYWNLVEEILPACRKEIMAHNGTLLVRGDSGDPIEIVTETVFRLWELFGGSVNSKGYKVLDPHVKAIYGDSITIQRAEKIYTILMENGFACNNVALGVGSFSMQCIEEDGMLKPFTRDTFSTAMKATYGEIGNASFEIFKNPKTDTGHFKKSQKGCCIVQKNDNGKLIYFDKLTYAETKAKDLVNYLVPIFKDGEMLKETSLKEIRGKLNGGMF
jgi:nicotinamide phosphoribosyltransferase